MLLRTVTIPCIIIYLFTHSKRPSTVCFYVENQQFYSDYDSLWFASLGMCVSWSKLKCNTFQGIFLIWYSFKLTKREWESSQMISSCLPELNTLFKISTYQVWMTYPHRLHWMLLSRFVGALLLWHIVCPGCTFLTTDRLQDTFFFHRTFMAQTACHRADALIALLHDSASR